MRKGLDEAAYGQAGHQGSSLCSRVYRRSTSLRGLFPLTDGGAVRVLHFTAACPGATPTMVKLSHFIILCCVLPLQWLRAADLSRMTLTEVVADVTIIDPGSKAIRPARVNDAFAAPQLLRTGRSSRAEMLAEDQTLTRIGANSLFSFVPGQRQINLQRGACSSTHQLAGEAERSRRPPSPAPFSAPPSLSSRRRRAASRSCFSRGEARSPMPRATHFISAPAR